MTRWGLFLTFCLLASIIPLASADASRVSPMSVELEPYGRQSIARIQFANTTSREFPVEVRAFRGEISEEGELTLIPADEDFIIFPPQLVVAPLGEQVFRVQYVGDPELPGALVYYMSVRQLPVELEDGPPQVQVLVNFNVFVNVEPDGTTAIARVDTIEAATGEEDSTGLSVRVANDGNGMLLAGKREWSIRGKTVTGEPFERDFNAAKMSVTIGVGVVAPGKARLFYVPLDVDVDPASVAIELK